MLVVDAQVHIWGADTPERPWPAGNAHRAHRPVPFSKDDLLAEMAAAGVDRAVIVPPSWEGDRNDLALAAAQAHPDKFAVMGRPPLDTRDPHALDHWREQKGMLGNRVTTAGHGARALFTEPEGDWLWQAAERAGLPAMVSIPGLLLELGKLAERHPGMWPADSTARAWSRSGRVPSRAWRRSPSTAPSNFRPSARPSCQQ